MAYKPEFPYRGKQIIIDSDRVLLNSKKDATFIVGNKAVGISSGGTINLDSTGDCIINSPNIRLGLIAKHPLVKGDLLQNALLEYLTLVNEIVAENLSTAVDSEGASLTKVQLAGDGLKQATSSFIKGLGDIVSKNNFTQ